MDDQPCRSFFLAPRSPAHRRYEALRAIFVDEHSAAEVADRYGYKLTTLDVLISRFRGQVRRDAVAPFFSPMAGAAPPDGRDARTATARRRPRSPISEPST